VISFKNLGRQGKLGNQLFQYVFLRTAARKLGVKFFCPVWIGDKIFNLKDEEERSLEPVNINKIYTETDYNRHPDLSDLVDGVDISGYFQTDDYFPSQDVRKWLTFRKDFFDQVIKKYSAIDFSQTTGMHLRYGDKVDLLVNRAQYYTCPPSYYRKALEKVNHKNKILVFSDDVVLAKKDLKGLRGNFEYISGNLPHEDLYLMSCCRDFISSSSSLSWWGAWLIAYNDKRVVCPQEGIFRPGYHRGIKVNSYWPDEWTKIRALNRVFGNFLVRSFLLLPTMKGSQIRENLPRFIKNIRRIYLKR
jgi:hypothetical protein